MARGRRLKYTDRTSVYHCITRVVAGERRLGVREREVLSRQIWRVADFCGVEVLSYCILSNHVHLLVRVPAPNEPSINEVARRLGVLKDWNQFQIESFRQFLDTDQPPAREILRKLRARMGDLSMYLKEIKQLFTMWYNRTHHRFGTLWAERYKSVLVENNGYLLKVVAAYINLNPIRAGICQDAKAYRWCAYAEALAGNPQARDGIQSLYADEPAGASWSSSLTEFRQLLCEKGRIPRTGKASIETEEGSEKADSADTLSLAQRLAQRIRCISEGMALGSRCFLSNAQTDLPFLVSGKKPTRPHPWQGDGWDSLMTLRKPRMKMAKWEE